MKVLQTALNIPADRVFSYLPPENVPPEFCLFKRLKVPFGKGYEIGYALRVEDFISPIPKTPSQDVLFGGGFSDVKTDGVKLKTVLEIIDDEPVLSEELLELARYICANYLCSLGEALACIISPAMRDLKSVKAKKKNSGISFPNKNSAQRSAIEYKRLTKEQSAAYERIKDALLSGKGGKFLLFGVTSSGKTEVYLKIIDLVLSLNKSAIFLIPEIALTAQFSDIVFERFGSIVGLWHSGVSAQKKFSLFKGALRGDIKIMLGARSAVFAPFKNIGAVIIDEEHEHTYKQEQKPSYDCRDIASWRAAYHGACLVLGSATPSLEIFSAAREGAIEMLEMPQRIDGKEMPQIKILSLKDKARFGANLLPETVSALSQTLKRKEQAIVFINRRGFSSSIMCRKCLNVYQCPNCSVSLAHHKIEYGAHILKCHYCGFSQNFTEVSCPNCKSKDLAVFGIGTQKIEDEIQKLFPYSRIFRLDGDTASKKGVYEKAYRGFKSGDYDILLGTQMISKGFDFERVSLVCIADADTSLYLPDFKSVEKTFQLIIQTAGRCGRGKTAGNVIVQTYHPEHYCIQCAKDYDFLSFYNEEIRRRESLFYPPFCSIAEITIRNKDEDKTFEEAQNLLVFCKEYAERNKISAQIFGPAECRIKKLNNLYRMKILLKGLKKDILSIASSSFKYQKTYSVSQIITDISPL
ncbi:MAG: primosomal protein N' [Elusimicrobiota bacterium]|jgi:primosomal protein N' (replication factor Y)|nr:primosomal protein N' [Elusimicrobiota bacterium]